MKNTAHSCPVCAYANLKEAPRSSSDGGSFEICPACGFQFGVSDDDDGISYDEWREDWLERGMEWSSIGIKKPKGWDPKKALTSLKKMKLK
jgi:hypothetical protein